MEPAQDRQTFVGIDFGTTNSSIAISTGDSQTQLISFPNRIQFGGETTFSYRSVLYMDQGKESGKVRTHSWTGPAAIEHYLAAEEKGRFIQSLKSHLSSRTLTGTAIFGRHYNLEVLISRILADLRQHAERQLGSPIRRAMVGRPVRFVGAENEQDDGFALERLRLAFETAGYETVDFEMEPIAAAYAYGSTLDHDELILIGDFGGGTSDFSLLTVGPEIRRRGRKPGDLLGSLGLGLAGDAFDARIIRKLVSPALGADSLARSLKKVLPAVPAWIYANLERWHYLSFLRTRNVTEILKSAHARALEPEKIEALINLIEEDLGYQLHQAVQRVKVELSQHQAAKFSFRDGSMDLEIAVTRAEFESWIADELLAIENCVAALFKTSGVDMREVDRVFLTGGTSFVPAVRSIFERGLGERGFGKDRVRTGEAFTSVARGLALRAEELGTS
ncbi:Putative heat shock protein YegD [Acidisarcina polymorpha]|uniref:Heat shock protein YegD n=1 Tax=Acidisarcina polymorpha TaxID=2211140 RepID=A0A2Z5FYF7_9BACT|nr:Hsp70 family protein [Acidisarcina polymorpha]AXC11554.1 Putative heat shock protein YegD [Acidisarcina polymorpha]